MKATLDFDLNDPDDRMDHKRCVKALDMALVLWEFYHNSKKSLEYKVEGIMTDKDEEFSPFDAINVVYEHFRELLNEYDINIDKLIR